MGKQIKEIEVNGKKITLQSLLFLDVIDLNEVVDKKKNMIKLFSLSGVDESILNELSIEDGSKILKEINELNGWTVKGDFQKASSTDKSL